MFKRTVSMITILAIALSFNLAQAEEGKRYEDSAKWKSVVKVNYKPGKRDEALGIIRDYYVKASIKAGTLRPESVLEMHTGDYDLLIIWHMKGGITDMTWEKSPDNIKWRAALNELAGSKEKAQEILTQYINCVETTENDIAMMRMY